LASRLLAKICNYILITFLIVGATISLIVLDCYSKVKNAQKDPTAAQQSQILSQQRAEEIFGWLISAPDYSKPFSVRSSVRWKDVLSVMIAVVLMLAWCYYYHIQRTLRDRDKLSSIEVQDFGSPITRMQSKQSLNMALETGARQKNNSRMFNKFWYRTREKALSDDLNGLLLDRRGFQTLAEDPESLMPVTTTELKKFDDNSPSSAKSRLISVAEFSND
jgi:hypothetical protein